MNVIVARAGEMVGSHMVEFHQKSCGSEKIKDMRIRGWKQKIPIEQTVADLLEYWRRIG